MHKSKNSTIGRLQSNSHNHNVPLTSSIPLSTMPLSAMHASTPSQFVSNLNSNLNLNSNSVSCSFREQQLEISQLRNQLKKKDIQLKSKDRCIAEQRYVIQSMKNRQSRPQQHFRTRINQTAQEMMINQKQNVSHQRQAELQTENSTLRRERDFYLYLYKEIAHIVKDTHDPTEMKANLQMILDQIR